MGISTSPSLIAGVSTSPSKVAGVGTSPSQPTGLATLRVAVVQIPLPSVIGTSAVKSWLTATQHVVDALQQDPATAAHLLNAVAHNSGKKTQPFSYEFGLGGTGGPTRKELLAFCMLGELVGLLAALK